MYLYSRPQVSQLVKIVENRSDMRIIAIIGPRQVGKTVIALQARKRLEEAGYTCHYVSFDDPRLNQQDWPSNTIPSDTMEIKDFAIPETLVNTWEDARKDSLESPKGHVLFLDEIHLIPKWSNYVKGLWDRDRRESYPLHIVILGSVIWQMLVGRNESLTGRFREIKTMHWSLPEIDQITNLTTEEFIYYGGYPASLLKESEESRFDDWHKYIIKTILGTVIGQDILLLHQIKKPALMRQLIEITPAYSGQIMAYNKLLGHLQDKDNAITVKHYLNLLSDAALITTLTRYTPKPHLRVTSHPKFNVLNTALMTAPSGYSFEESQVNRSFWGRVVESAVGAHLCNTRKAATQIHYWRDKSGNYEVDFVIARGPHLIGIEVKSGKKQTRQGLNAFKEHFPHAKTMIVGSSGIAFNEFFSYTADEWIDENL